MIREEGKRMEQKLLNVPSHDFNSNTPNLLLEVISVTKHITAHACSSDALVAFEGKLEMWRGALSIVYRC